MRKYTNLRSNAVMKHRARSFPQNSGLQRLRLLISGICCLLSLSSANFSRHNPKNVPSGATSSMHWLVVGYGSSYAALIEASQHRQAGTPALGALRNS